MRVLVTGLQGFVGAYFKKALEANDHEVYGIDIQGNDRNIYSADITDFSSLSGIWKKVNPEAVIHMAAISRVDFKNPEKLYAINVFGTLNVLKACLELESLPKFLFVSSSQVYGKGSESPEPVGEQHPVQPVSHYGASKAAAENIVRAFYYDYGLPSVIARPFNHTGKDQPPHFVIPKMVEAFKKKEKTINMGNIEVLRDISDVRDVVNAYVKIVENFNEGECYNIASGKGTKVIDIFKTLSEITGHSMEMIKDEAFTRKNDVFFSVGNADKIRNDLNWVSQYAIESTLRSMLID